MPADLPAMTGASSIRIDIGGRKLLFSQLTIGDLGRISAWLKGMIPDPFQVAKQALLELDGLPPDSYAAARDLILTSAYADKKINKVPLNSPEALAHLSDPEGLSLVLWLAARPMHPEITLEQMRSMIDGEPAAGMQEKIKKAFRLIRESMDVGESANPTEPAP